MRRRESEGLGDRPRGPKSKRLAFGPEGTYSPVHQLDWKQ